MPSETVQIELINAKEFGQTLRDIPQILAPLVRQELKRAGKRAERVSKKESLAGPPGIRLPRKGRNIARTKAQKSQIKSLAWGSFEDIAQFILVLKGSRFLKWHQLKGKIFRFLNPLKNELPPLAQKLESAIGRAWQIAADRNLRQRFRF
jgi:hypothetical protein